MTGNANTRTRRSACAPQPRRPSQAPPSRAPGRHRVGQRPPVLGEDQGGNADHRGRPRRRSSRASAPCGRRGTPRARLRRQRQRGPDLQARQVRPDRDPRWRWRGPHSHRRGERRLHRHRADDHGRRGGQTRCSADPARRRSSAVAETTGSTGTEAPIVHSSASGTTRSSGSRRRQRRRRGPGPGATRSFQRIGGPRLRRLGQR